MSSPALIKATLIFAIGTSSLAGQVFMPTLPAVQNDFDVAAAQVQLTVSVPLFATAVGTLLWGVLSDRYGRRPMLFWGFLMFLAGTVMCYYAPTITVLAVSRVIQSFGSAAGFVISRAVIRDLYGRERAAAELASLIAIMIIAPMFGPLIGGVITDFAGWRAVFGAIGVITAGVAVMIFFCLGETNHHRLALPSFIGLFGGYRTLMRSADFRAYALQSGFMVSVFNVFMAAAPYVVIVIMGSSAKEYGLWFVFQTVGYLVGNLIANRFAQKLGIDALIRRALILSLVSNFGVLFVVIAGLWTPAAIFIPLFGMGIANGIAMPNANAGAVSVHPELAGTASGLISFIQLGLAAVFAQAAGSIQNGTPYPMAVFMCLCAVLATLAFHGFKGTLFRRQLPAE